MKEMYKIKKNRLKAVVAFAVALAFVMPVAAVANLGMIGVTSDSENTDDMEIMVESTNSNNNYNLDYREDPIIAEEITDTTLPTLGTIYVDDDAVPPYDGTPAHPYRYIQDGIDNATAEDTIYVLNGTYYENVVVNKQLDLVGESREGVIVDGSGSGNVFDIAGPVTHVSISTFTITNGRSGHGGRGINIEESSNNNVITDCKVYNNTNGVWIEGYSNNNSIINCEVYNNSGKYNAYGIWIWESSNSSITNCKVYNNKYGFYITASSNCNLKGNSIYDNVCNFGVGSGSGTIDLSYFYHHMMDSPLNTIDGKYIYYLVEQENITLDENYNFGYLGLVSCKNITAKNSDVGGILVVNTTDSTISNVDSHHSAGNGILIYMSSDNNIADCDVYDNNREGIFIHWYSNDNNIINCNTYNNEIGIHIKHYSNNNNITNCNTYNNNYGIRIQAYSSGGSITNCDIYGNRVRGIDISGYTGSLPYNITDCRIYNNSDGGITLKYGDHSNIINCTSYNNEYCYGGIQIWSSKYSNIINCTSYNNKYGFYVTTSSDYNNITNCNAYNNWMDGIYFRSFEHNVVTDCNTYNNSRYGIYIYQNSNNNDITNCNAYDNKYGIYFKGSSNNDITNCSVYNNDYEGIDIYDESSGNIITECDIYDNARSIYIWESSDNNVIHHNNFVNNVESAYDECSNWWDDGTEGNYWDDYGGVDADNNGIGDTPYNISGKTPPNQDRFPLMNPWDETTPPAIANVQAVPPKQKPGETVNITCTVTDNWGLVDTVKVNITGPEGFILEVTMNKDEGSSYYYEDTYTTLGTYYYYIWANDTSGNNATSDVYHFVITEGDIDPPEISDVALMTSDPIDASLPDNPPGFIGGWENVTCTVIDTGIGVNQVKLIVTYKTTTVEHPMTNIPETDTYYYNTSLTDAGNYTYHVWADDISGNDATSSHEPFALPPNWDVDMDGRTYSNDLMRILWTYTDTGPKGWIREDIDNNGKVYSNDLMNILWHYGERWWT